MTMDARMGPEMPAEAKAWWTDFMGATHTSTMIGFMRNLSKIDVSADMEAIRCPTMVVATDSAYRPLSEITPWQSRIPNSRLAVIPSGGFHPAAVVLAEFDLVSDAIACDSTGQCPRRRADHVPDDQHAVGNTAVQAFAE